MFIKFTEDSLIFQLQCNITQEFIAARFPQRIECSKCQNSSMIDSKYIKNFYLWQLTSSDKILLVFTKLSFFNRQYIVLYTSLVYLHAPFYTKWTSVSRFHSPWIVIMSGLTLSNYYLMVKVCIINKLYYTTYFILRSICYKTMLYTTMYITHQLQYWNYNKVQTIKLVSLGIHIFLHIFHLLVMVL